MLLILLVTFKATCLFFASKAFCLIKYLIMDLGLIAGLALSSCKSQINFFIMLAISKQSFQVVQKVDLPEWLVMIFVFF